MLRIPTLGAGSVAIAASLVLHAGAVTGFAAVQASRSADTPVDVEVASIPQARASASQAIQPAVLGQPAPVAAPLTPAPPLPPRSPRVQSRSVSSPRTLPMLSATAPTVPADTPARFVLPGNAATRAAPSQLAPRALPIASEPTLSEAEVSVAARLIASAPLVYPPRARAAEVEASVSVEIVVDTRGRVVDARLLVPAGYGLDEAALAAVRSYRFSPAKRLGEPVRVRMRWSVLFRLR
jgi:protein TonB